MRNKLERYLIVLLNQTLSHFSYKDKLEKQLNILVLNAMVPSLCMYVCMFVLIKVGQVINATKFLVQYHVPEENYFSGYMNSEDFPIGEDYTRHEYPLPSSH